MLEVGIDVAWEARGEGDGVGAVEPLGVRVGCRAGVIAEGLEANGGGLLPASVFCEYDVQGNAGLYERSFDEFLPNVNAENCGKGRGELGEG